MKQTRITGLTLKNFRVHRYLELATDAHIVIMMGNNGVGKTSVLEAISMMSPGKGLLNAANYDYINKSDHGGTADECDIAIDTNADFFFHLQTECKANKCLRKVSINNKSIHRQVDLLQWINVLWLTSNMLHNLSLSVSDRRKFFDRATFYIAPEHAQQINLYEKLLRERLKLLTGNSHDTRWLSALELQIADVSVAIMQNRLVFLDKFKEVVSKLQDWPMPIADIEIVGEIEKLIVQNVDMKEIKQEIIIRLHARRKLDSVSGRTNFGVHKSDFVVKDSIRQIALAILSSGERKMLLMSITYTIATVLSEFHVRRPIILVDELISFLDEDNTAKLLNSFQCVSSQIWVATAVQIPQTTDDMKIISLS